MLPQPKGALKITHLMTHPSLPAPLIMSRTLKKISLQHEEQGAIKVRVGKLWIKGNRLIKGRVSRIKIKIFLMNNRQIVVGFRHV